MVLSLLLASVLMASKAPTTLIFSGGDRGPWPAVSANGQILGVLPHTPCEPPTPACYGMGRLQDGTIWAATYSHFFTVSGDQLRRQGLPVETIAGSGTRHLYRIRRGESLRLQPPAMEHAALLEEIDPRTWEVTRGWTLPGHYGAYGSGHLAVDEAVGMAYIATERHPITHASEAMGVVRRFDLRAGAALSDLIGRSIGSGGLLVLADGSIIVGYIDGVQRIASDGSLLQTYPVGALRIGQGLLAAGATGSSFWVQGFADGTPYSTLFEFNLNGTLRHQWDTPANGVQWDAPFVDPPTAGDAGTMVVSSDATWHWVDPADGTELAAPANNPTAAAFSQSFGGVSTRKDFAWIDGLYDFAADATGIRIFTPDLTRVATVNYPPAGLRDLHGLWATAAYFYSLVRDSPAYTSHLYWYDLTGTLQGSRTIDDFVFNPSPSATHVEAKVLAVSPDDAYAYVATLFPMQVVRRVPLPSGAEEDFITLGSQEYVALAGQHLAVIPSTGDILVSYFNDTTFQFYVNRYNAAGVLQATYPIGGVTGDSSNFTVAIFLGQTDETFWSAFYENATPRVRLRELRLSDGVELTTWTKPVPGSGHPDWSGAVYGMSRRTPMACPDPCEKAGTGVPYVAFAPEQLATYFCDRAFQVAQIDGQDAMVTSVGACAIAPSSEGVWICMDDADSGLSTLILVDPMTIDADTGECQILRGPIPVEVRIAELGGRHALFVLDCDRLLTSDRTTHELIEICLPAAPETEGDPEGTALVAKRYALIVDPLDAQLVDGGENLLYIDASGVAKVYSLTNDTPLKTVGAVGGIWPVILNDKSFLVYTGAFLDASGTNEVLRYSRTGKLLTRYPVEIPSIFSKGLYGMAADILTDACDCGNPKDGIIWLPGEDDIAVIPVSLLDGTQEPYIYLQDSIPQGATDTAAAFTVLKPSEGSGFSDQSGGTVRRPQPNRHCGPEAGINSVAPNPGCNAGGKGWIPTYTGASGTVPAASDPTDEETLTNKDTVFVRVKIRHTNYPSGTEELLCYAKTDLAVNLTDPTQHPHALPRVLSIGDDDRGFSDGQGNMVSGSTTVQFMDADGRPFGFRLTSPTRQFWTRSELVLEAISDEGLRTNAVPRRIGTGLIYGEQYGGPVIFGLTAVDPLFIEGGSFGPDKKVPQFTYPLDYYTGAPKDLAQVPIPFYYGEVSDEGAVSPVTGQENSRGKCSVRFVGYDTIGIVPGGATAGRFNICRSACYKIIALYGPDLGGLGLYGAKAVASNLDVGDPTDTTQTTAASIIALDGSPDLSEIATDGSMQIVLFGTSGRTEAVIVAVDNFAKTVTLESGVDATLFAGVPWYLSSIDYVPRRVKIDLATRNGVDVHVPTWAGFIRPTPYEDIPTSQGTIRVTDMWATGAILAAHLDGEVTMAVNLIGREDKGDGSGLPIIDYFSAFNHFLDNEVHIQTGAPSGPGGLWPQVEADLPRYADGFSKTKQSSFAAAQAITVRALGGRGLQVHADFTEAISTQDALQRWIENGACKAGVDAHGRVMIWMLDRYADPTTFPRIRHDQRVFGDLPQRHRALDEAYNTYIGGCDWDPEAQVFREDDLKTHSYQAIRRNKGFVRTSKHMDLKLLALKEQALWVLGQALLVNKDGPNYVTISGLDRGVLDVPIGSGIRFSSPVLPGATEDGMIDQPLVILHRLFDLDLQEVTLTCLDLGTEAAGNSLLIPTTQQMVATDTDVKAPIATDDDDVAPRAA